MEQTRFQASKYSGEAVKQCALLVVLRVYRCTENCSTNVNAYELDRYEVAAVSRLLAY